MRLFLRPVLVTGPSLVNTNILSVPGEKQNHSRMFEFKIDEKVKTI